MRRVERKELKYSNMNRSVDCLLRSSSVGGSGREWEGVRGREGGREGGEGCEREEGSNDIPMNCGTSFTELIAALKNASPE